MIITPVMERHRHSSKHAKIASLPSDLHQKANNWKCVNENYIDDGIINGATSDLRQHAMKNNKLSIFEAFNKAR